MGCRTVSSGNKITNCGSCGEVLLGDAIKVAANLHYHIHCFTCTECGCELVNTGFFTKLAKYYCAEDYHALFGTLCTLCQKYIEGEGLSIQGKGKSYHISCLTCSKCGGRFDEGSRITFEKEAALCDACKVTGVKTSATKHLCAACQEVIVGTSIYAMDQEWHMNCFSCQECKKALTGEYMCKDGVPYCEEDYQTLYGQCCNICSEFILGKVLQAGGNSYHTSCLKCYICTQQFEEGQEIFMQDELFWHTDCDETTEHVIEEQKPIEVEVEDEEKVEQEKAVKEEMQEEPEEGEKTPPELVLPPPPDSTPPPDTPLTETLEDQLTTPDVFKDPPGTLTADDIRDRSKSSVSILSDYEDLTVLKEADREVVYDSDFEETANPEVSVRTSKSQSTSSVEPKQSDSDEPKKILSVSDSLASSKHGEVEKEEVAPSATASESEPAMSESGGSVSSVPKGSEPHSTTLESDVSVDKQEVFGDVSDTVVIKENGRGSLTSEQEQEQKEEEEERHLSVKEILRLAQEKERETMGNAVLVRKNKVDPTISRRYLSTDSENSDRGSEASDPPAKPPRSRSKSPVRNKPEMIVQPTMKSNHGVPDTAPSATLKGLRTVDSPILKLMDEMNRPDEEQIDYLDYQDTYDISILQSQKVRLPKGIDRSQLQQYLSDEQFEAAFKMSQEKFDSLPLWKKTNLKKSLHLF
uniref:ABLIM class LIM protein ML093519b n=1 Tax=Mnemiopsis leidyi TaxID=27923 RepID=H2DJX1_MNELE|nr:ABLIM class LIM protein ML093519b [Mnemiopsis leidyi]